MEETKRDSVKVLDTIFEVESKYQILEPGKELNTL